ncbi:Acyl-CoA thioesterase Tes2p, putative [Candida maltosa Xu316]|uniref:Acyl-CoA thioesterase Tes2p, putative n=1 Tax=Candida maltosa (strain Xu316) TaxID=1245528 RepID=M3K771_CANMX|nr:Acyl-CoA thioesterase Tes2p, putative [Candida maltosa Xu316]
MIDAITRDVNYPKGEAVDLEIEFGVDKIGPNLYRGRRPIAKPDKRTRGSFGGDLAGQALLVAMKSTPQEFRPHSFHSYFVKAVHDKTCLEWKVEETSNGRNYANRSLQAFQDGDLVYTASVSLTKKNSSQKALKETGEKPFEFQTPKHQWFDKHKIDDLPVAAPNGSLLLYHKFFPEVVSLDASRDEDNVAAAERKLSWYFRWGIDNEGGHHQPLANLSPDFHYVGLAALTDSVYLTRLLRVLRIEDVDHAQFVHYFSVSLDHTMYFHDVDFDVTKWLGFSFKVTRFSHNRALCQGEVYNDKGVHVATIIQEGLIMLNGLEAGAKL